MDFLKESLDKKPTESKDKQGRKKKYDLWNIYIEKIKQEQNKIGLYIFYIYKAIATYIGNFTRSPNQHKQQKVN